MTTNAECRRDDMGEYDRVSFVSNPYRQEALSNPCRSMPAWQDVTVAAVARLTDEMLERAVIVGFIGAWLCDRAVEAGASPYDAQEPARFAAVVAVCAYLEVRLRRSSKRNRQTMRAFRVQRDKITGKQKMVPMDEEDVEKIMGGDGGKRRERRRVLGEGKGEGQGQGEGKAEKEKEKEGVVGVGKVGGVARVPEGLGGFGLPERIKTVDVINDAASKGEIPKEVAEEVAGMVEALIGEEDKDESTSSSSSSSSSSSRSSGTGVDTKSPATVMRTPEDEDAAETPEENTVAAATAASGKTKGSALSPPLPPVGGGPMVMSPGQLGASPVGSIMFNASVKQLFDGFRSRLTLITACLCYVTSPDLNLWAPVAGGLVCDLLFIVHQRNGLARFLEAAGVVTAAERGAGPATDAQIKRAQMKLLKRDLDRRRRALAGQLMVWTLHFFTHSFARPRVCVRARVRFCVHDTARASPPPFVSAPLPSARVVRRGGGVGDGVCTMPA